FRGLPERRRLEREIRLLQVPAGLQQPAELHVLDEADPLPRLVDDERRGGEGCGAFVSRQRVVQRFGESEHRASVGLLALAARDVGAEDVDHVVHSYWRASRMFRRDARRAGKIAARMPTRIAASAKTMSEPTGSEKTMKSTL